MDFKTADNNTPERDGSLAATPPRSPRTTRAPSRYCARNLDRAYRSSVDMRCISLAIPRLRSCRVLALAGSLAVRQGLEYAV